jgi:hypothetical protein
MNARLVEAKLKTALSGVGATVVIGYDQTHAPATSQVVVSATSTPTTFNAAGKPMDYSATCRCLAVTHNQDDKSGATRRALTAAILSAFAALSLSTMSITGYTCVALSSLDVEEATAWGDEFIAEASVITLQYMAA